MRRKICHLGGPPDGRGRAGGAGTGDGGEPFGDSVTLGKLVIDSREVSEGDLFAAIKGTRVDGHSFAPKAFGRRCGVINRAQTRRFAPQLVVRDITSASGRFGHLKRCAFEGAVVAITGSAGKTTTKNLLAAALAPVGAVHATTGNQNNELGVPMTLAGLSTAHQFGVIEMGAGSPGDIAYLCELARPDVAICLNASAAHLANYPNVEAIAATKGEIFEGLGARDWQCSTLMQNGFLVGVNRRVKRDRSRLD